MTPSCEDNYGLDSCSLLVLQCSPPVLVIATSGGQLHHCVVIDQNNKDMQVNILVRLQLSSTVEINTSLTIFIMAC